MRRFETFAPIRVRVTTVAALAVLLAALLGSVVFVRILHGSLQAGLVATDNQEVADLTAQLAKGASPQQVVVTGGSDVVVQLVGTDGTVLAGHAAKTDHPLMTSAGTALSVRVSGHRDHFVMVARRVDDAGPVALVVAGRSTEQVARATGISLALLVVAVPLAVLLVGITVWLSVGRALRPVEAMRRDADEITSAHLDRRLPIPPGRDEIPRLATTINEMLARIQQSHRLQRQFVSDASHELRSPLAVIRQSAEVARAYPDRVALAGLADDVLAESRRLEDLVTALLMLARLDDGHVVADSDLVDLDDLVLREVGRVRAVPHLSVDVSHVSSGQVRGGSILLGQVVRNLIDNAVRHATSRIVLAVSEHDGVVELTVDDDGEGITESDRGRVFDRFVRLDSARAREEGGAGLGLAIVRNIVQLAEGTIDIDTSPLGGARFVIRLPATA